MAKRKITVTVDAELIAFVQQLGANNLSSVVNDALIGHAETLARRSDLEALLAEWDAAYGPISPDDQMWAADAFDEADSGELRSAGAA